MPPVCFPLDPWRVEPPHLHIHLHLQLTPADGDGFVGEEVVERDGAVVVEGHCEPAADLATAPAGTEAGGEGEREDLAAVEPCPPLVGSGCDCDLLAGRSAAAATAPWTRKRCGGPSSPPPPPRTSRAPPVAIPSSSAASASTPRSTAASSAPSSSAPASPAPKGTSSAASRPRLPTSWAPPCSTAVGSALAGYP